MGDERTGCTTCPVKRVRSLPGWRRVRQSSQPCGNVVDDVRLVVIVAGTGERLVSRCCCDGGGCYELHNLKLEAVDRNAKTWLCMAAGLPPRQLNIGTLYKDHKGVELAVGGHIRLLLLPACRPAVCEERCGHHGETPDRGRVCYIRGRPC